MNARKVMEIWPSAMPEAIPGHDVYVHGQVAFEGDDRDLVIVACRAWCWDKIGEKSSYIRSPPSIDQDFETKIWRSRARISVLVHSADKLVGFGELKERSNGTE